MEAEGVSFGIIGPQKGKTTSDAWPGVQKQKMSYTISNSIAVKIWRNDAIQSETSSYVFVKFPLGLAVNFTCVDHASFFNTVRARIEVVLIVQGKEKQSPKEVMFHPKMWRLLLGPFVADRVRVRVRSDVK